MSTTVTTTAPGLGRKLVLGLACCALAACTSSGSPSTSNGGSNGTGVGGTGAPAGPGGSPGAGGSATGLGGSNVGAGGSGADNGFGGSGATGAITGTGGTSPFTGDAGTSGTGLGGSGAVGAGGTTGGGGGSPGGGACSAVFCDGFEGSSTLDTTVWTVDEGVPANVVEVVSNKSHTGSNSVHMHFTTANGATFIHETKGFPAPMNSLWGRVWLFVMNDPTSNGHDVYIEASDGVAGTMTNHGVRPLNTDSGSMEVNIDPNAGGGEDTKSANMPLPRGAWTCFEWQIMTTGTTGSVSLYMGGAAPAIATVPNTKIPALVEMRVGYEHYRADNAAGDLWIDDYAIGTSRVTCN